MLLWYESVTLVNPRQAIGADLDWGAPQTTLVPVVLGDDPMDVASKLQEQINLGWVLVYHYTDRAGNQIGIFKRP